MPSPPWRQRSMPSMPNVSAPPRELVMSSPRLPARGSMLHPASPRKGGTPRLQPRPFLPSPSSPRLMTYPLAAPFTSH
jgi:hypothetical protein